MCDDCDGATGSVTRRQLLWTPPLALGAALVGAAPAEGATRTVARICPPSWGASAPSGVFVPHQISRITVHHSAVVLRDNRKAPGQLRAFQTHHQARGWPDIAYHLLVDRNGNVYRGRPLWAAGDTSTSYDPSGHLLVLALGNFEVQDVAAAQLDATINVLAWACRRYGIAPRSIHGHRTYAATACPGARLQRSIANGTVRRRVSGRLGEIRMRDLCADAGHDRVHQIENGA